MTNADGKDAGIYLSDGRVTLCLLPWKISLFNGGGVEQPGMDHIGFCVESIDQLIEEIAVIAQTNPQIAARSINYNDEAKMRRELLETCPHGSFQLADPDGTLIDVIQR